MDMNECIVERHTISTLTNLFKIKQKGSNNFRNVLVPYVSTDIDFLLDKWKTTLNTKRICESEIKMGYQMMQCKLFSCQLLDFKARLILRKTQFPNTIAKWSIDVSPGCKLCTARGDFQIVQQITDTDRLEHRASLAPLQCCILWS